MEDRRSRIRYEVRWPVKVMISQRNMEAEIRNVSASGAFVCCEEPFKPKERLHLNVEFPGCSLQVLLAEVIWSTAPGPDDGNSTRGMGVRFLW